MKRYTSFILALFALSGCAGADSANGILKEAIGSQRGILYVNGKMQNPKSAEVIKVKGEEIALTNHAILLYGASGVVGAELQKTDPKDYPSNSPGQIVWVKLISGEELNATYRLDMCNPYTFRVKDAVTVDVNGSKVVGIRSAFDNPQNLDINGSAK